MSQISEYNSIMPIIIMKLKAGNMYQKVYLTLYKLELFSVGNVFKFC